VSSSSSTSSAGFGAKRRDRPAGNSGPHGLSYSAQRISPCHSSCLTFRYWSGIIHLPSRQMRGAMGGGCFDPAHPQPDY
jgi:hypothetical protein